MNAQLADLRETAVRRGWEIVHEFTDKAPTPEEMASCITYIEREVEIVEPKVIVAVGKTAALGLLGLDVPVGRARGRFHDYRGIPSIVTYHPSYLLRTDALSERRKVWEDLLMAMEELGMPISEKQRRFFLPT